MLAILALAAAATGEVPPLLKGPVPVAPMQEWISGGDPVQMPKGETIAGPLNFALTISAEGSVIRCAVERSSASPSLDDQTCQIFAKRGQFHAALDSAGKPTMGVYRVIALWAAPGKTASVTPLVEMAVGLQKMPQGLSDPAYVDIAVSVDQTGKVDGCVTAEALDWAGQTMAERLAAGNVLGATACAQAVTMLKLDAARNTAGQAVRSVQMATALFTANAAGAAASAAQPNPNDIVVKGKREAKIPYKGSDPITDYQVIGYELVLLQSKSGQWYRATLEPPCIGNSSLMHFSKDGAEIEVESALIDSLPRELRTALENQQGLFKRLPPGMMVDEGLGFTTHADGTFDRFNTIVAKVIDPQDVVHIERCHMLSLVESDPPAVKAKKKAR